MFLQRFLITILFSFLFVTQALAYSSITVPIEDPVYRKLDKLAAFGLIKTMMRGQRPYVRSEIGRLIAEALKNYPQFEKQYRQNPDLSFRKSAQLLQAKVAVDRTLKDLKRIYRKELIQRGALPGKVPTIDGALLEYLQADYLYLDEPKQIIPPDNGIGGINAILQPLVEDREGRHYQSGSNWAFETLHWVRLGKYFAFQLQPRFQMQIAKAPLQDETKVFVQRLNGHFTFGKLDLEIGRDSLNWGASLEGGLGFTSNPRPLDFLKLSSISPFRYPFFFRHMGFNKMSLVLANLGPEQTFKNPWLVAYKISNRRTEYFELGISQLLLLGGEGAPSESFGQRVLTFFALSRNENKEHRGYSVELIGRVPKLRGTELYTELFFSDFTSNMKTLFVDNTSYLVGAYIPRLTFTGSLDLRLEYRRLALRYARSRVFTDGVTENRLLIGDPLGPDSYAITARLSYELNPKNLFKLYFRYSHRRNRRYQQNGSSIITVANLGEEDRFLYRAGLRHLFNRYLVGNVDLGLEHVLNENFVSNNDALHWLAQVGFRVYFQPMAGL